MSSTVTYLDIWKGGATGMLFLCAVIEVATENVVADSYWGEFLFLSDQILTKKISLEGHFPAIWRL